MEIFEIHITGNESIHSVAKQFDYKTIAVDLLNPLGILIRTEHMTSLVVKAECYEDCLTKVKEIEKNLSSCEIERVKIECPYYEHYKDQSLYMESHFESKEMKLPTSKNQRKTTLLATDRVYNQVDYNEFRVKYNGEDLELCLFDTNIDQDKDWFNYYQEKQ